MYEFVSVSVIAILATASLGYLIVAFKTSRINERAACFSVALVLALWAYMLYAIHPFTRRRSLGLLVLAVVVFANLMGTLLFKEKLKGLRMVSSIVIAAGVIILMFFG